MTVEAWDHDQKERLGTGTFLTTDTQIDTLTGTIRIKALFDNKDMTLFPNQFVNAKLIVGHIEQRHPDPHRFQQLNPQEASCILVSQ